MNPENSQKAYIIAKQNILSVISLSTKKIIEKSCFQETIDDFSIEFINFLNNLEHVLYFCLKGTTTQFDHQMPNHPWLLFKSKCNMIPNNCIETILHIESIANNFAKLRALIKMALIEKRLSTYLTTAFSDSKLNRKFYSNQSIVLSSQFSKMVNEFLGLDAIDFNFDLKLDMNHPGFNPIDYSVFLKYYQSAESVLDDLKECGNSIENNLHRYCPWKEKYDLIFEKCKKESKQKNYLEEMLLVKTTNLDAAEHRNVILESELKIMEESVTDLQVQLALLHEQYTKELNRLSGNAANNLSIPSGGVVIGSRADLTSTRHRLTAQMSEIERTIVGEPLKPCSGTESAIVSTDNSVDIEADGHNTTSVDIIPPAEDARANTSTAQLDISSTMSENSTTQSIKRQKMTKNTKHYFSPSTKEFYKLTTNPDTLIHRKSVDLNNNSMKKSAASHRKTSYDDSIMDNPQYHQQQTQQHEFQQQQHQQQQQLQQQQQSNSSLKPKFSNNNINRNNHPSLLNNNYESQNSNKQIYESQQLRRLMSKANRSATLDSISTLTRNGSRRDRYLQQHSNYLLSSFNMPGAGGLSTSPPLAAGTDFSDALTPPTSHLLDFDGEFYGDNYTDLIGYSLDDLGLYNSNNVHDNQSSHHSKKSDKTRSHQPNIRYHSPSNPQTYYQMSAAFLSEELIDDNYFEVHSQRAAVAIIEPVTTTLGHSGNSAPQSQHHLIESPHSPTYRSIHSSAQLMEPPQIVRLSPLVTAEVPQDVEPIPTREQEHITSSTNGDRNSPNNNS